MGNFNSTIVSKKKRCKSCGNLDYIFSKGRCKHCATIEDTQKRMAQFEDKEETESLQNLIDDLDAIYSVYIRTKDATPEGYNECYTCGKVDRWQSMDCGHYVSRGNMSTRFYTGNTKCQCVTCNQYMDGNIPAFEAHLERDQKGTVEMLQELGRQYYKFSINELKGMIVEYRQKVELIKRKFK